MARFRGTFPARAIRTNRRLTSWELGTGGTAVATRAAPGSQFVGSAIALAAGASRLTVIRIRGYFNIILSLATSAKDGMTGAFGIGLATTAAVTAGIASVPTPITEQNSDNWLYWQAFSVKGAQAYAAGAAPGLEQMNTFKEFIIDSKAQRKMDDEMSIYAALEVVEVGAATIDFHHDSRALVLLP